jgi:hypothetical protein
MEKIMPSLLVLAIIIALKTLVAMGKIDPVYIVSVITGVMGWLIPTPKVVK